MSSPVGVFRSSAVEAAASGVGLSLAAIAVPILTAAPRLALVAVTEYKAVAPIASIAGPAICTVIAASAGALPWQSDDAQPAPPSRFVLPEIDAGEEEDAAASWAMPAMIVPSRMQTVLRNIMRKNGNEFAPLWRARRGDAAIVLLPCSIFIIDCVAAVRSCVLSPCYAVLHGNPATGSARAVGTWRRGNILSEYDSRQYQTRPRLH